MLKDGDAHAGVIMMAFVMGAITGAAAVLFMAPALGTETRHVLNEKAQEGREKAKDAARRGTEFIKRQRDQFSTAIDRGREAYQQARSDETVLVAEDQE